MKAAAAQLDVRLTNPRIAMNRVQDLLARCGTTQSVMPATELYNEGWMLRLLLDWHSRSSAPDSPLSFAPEARWYSEALLSSQFGPRFRGDPLAEGFTHADGVIGHYSIRPDRGDVVLNPSPEQFVVTEAKMFSGLSAGTTRAKDFDQAARNAACIAHLLSTAQVAPDRFKHIALYIIAPSVQWERGVFGSLLSKQSIADKVAARCRSYDGAKKRWLEEWFLPTIDRLTIAFLSWESLCEEIKSVDSPSGLALEAFLDRCIEFNRPRQLSAAT